MHLSHNQGGLYSSLVSATLPLFTFIVFYVFPPLDYTLYKGKVICIPEYNIAGPQIIEQRVPSRYLLMKG